MDDPRVGTVVDGRYRVDERLAAGGTGVVYVGTQLGLNRAVAVKFLHKSSAQSRTHAGRFEREARVMSQMGHPNIAQIIDFGSDEEGSHYLVMELCKGVSLRELLTQGPMDLHRMTHIAKQILAGLAHAHDANIVHRDLKPGNVLLVDSLGEGHIKILDFGVAKILSTEGPSELSVAAGRPLGTPHYMSPEQATCQSVDARADIYALGVMMYEMTTGKRPFDAGLGFALLRQHVEDAAQRPRELREMSSQLENVILRAMEKDPDNRFQTAAEMMDALSRVPEAATRTGTAPGKRKRALIAAISFTALGAAAGVGWYGVQQGWFDRSSGDNSAHAQASTGIDAATAAPLDAANASGDAGKGKASLPPWKPPAATVIIPERTPFPTIDKQTLEGKLAGKPFHPRFAVLQDLGDKLLLRLTDVVPQARFCSDLKWDDVGGTRVSLPLPTLPKEDERLRSPRRSRAEVTTGKARRSRGVRWQLRFSKLDANAQIGVGSIRLKGRKIRLRGDFTAAYCGPGAAHAATPTVNGVAWAPKAAPDPDELPVQAVAGAFAQSEILPVHVNVSNASAPLQNTLTFFAKAPADPCSQLGAADVGAAVTLPGIHKDVSMTSLLPAKPTSTEASAVFRLQSECSPASSDCSPMIELRASTLSIKVDAVLTGELRGRIYLAAPGPRPSLLVGAFRARDCRKAEPAQSSEVPIDAGAANTSPTDAAGDAGETE